MKHSEVLHPSRPIAIRALLCLLLLCGVAAANPTFQILGNQTVAENSGAQSVAGFAYNYQPNAAGAALAGYTISSNSNPVLFSSQPSVNLAGTLSFTPAANQNGTATIGIYGRNNTDPTQDSTYSDILTFTITVTAVNYPPTFTGGGDKGVGLNAGAQSVANFITNLNLNDPGQTLVDFAVGNDNTALFSVQPDVSNARTLTFTPAANASGVATVTVTATDNGPDNNVSAPYQFTIRVLPPPTLTVNGRTSEFIEVGDLFTDPGVTAFDGLGSPLTVVVTGSVNTATPGTYTLGYQVTDAAGQTASGSRDVTVTADTPVHYVSAAGSDTYPHDTPAKAAHTIQDAVDAASPGDTVLVADGTYDTGSRTLAGKNLASRVLVQKAIHIVSENGPATTVITGAFATGGDAPFGADAVRGVYLGGGATLEGFTITGGSTTNGDGSMWEDVGGGGLYIEGAATVTGCHVSGNRAYRFAGGIHTNLLGGATIADTVISGNIGTFVGGFGGGVFAANATLTGCTVSGNSCVAPSRGGGAYLTGNSVVTDCTFENNSAKEGAGLYVYHSGEPTIERCVFSGNTCTDSGGGLYLTSVAAGNPGANITACRFEGNTATLSGGGLLSFNLRPVISRCVFRGNQCGALGGGLASTADPAYLDNCLFAGNKAATGGGAAILHGTVRTSTFSANSATSNGGAISTHSQASNLACTNSILYNNAAAGASNTESATAFTSGNGTIAFRLCIVENSGAPGSWFANPKLQDFGGNLDADPAFLGPVPPAAAPTTAGDFHPDPAGSPAIDAGDPSIVIGTLDLDGKSRFFGPTVDLGAYELLYSSDPTVHLFGGFVDEDFLNPANWTGGSAATPANMAAGHTYRVFAPAVLDGASVLSGTLEIDSVVSMLVGPAGSLGLQSGCAVTGGGTLTVGGLLQTSGAGAMPMACPLVLDNTTPGGRALEVGPGTTLQTTGGVTFSAGEAMVRGIWQHGQTPLEVPANATLLGDGTLAGGVDVHGRLEPGPDTGYGDLHIQGNLTCYNDSTTRIEIGGSGAGEFDRIVVSGLAPLGGTLLADFTERPLAPAGTYVFLVPTSGTMFGYLTRTPVALAPTRTLSYNYGSTSDRFTITNTGTPYQDWAFASGLTLGGNDGFGDDPNQDGVLNIDHFAFDTNPLTSGGDDEGKRHSGFITWLGAEHIVLILPVRRGAVFTGSPSPGATIDGIAYSIQGSTNLQTWTEIVSELPIGTALPPLRDIDGDGTPDWVYHTFILDNGTLPRGFLRGVVESAP